MSVELPPLPRPFPNSYPYSYTGDQMRAYARAAERAAYERAAQECKQAELGNGWPSEWDRGYNRACYSLAERIRKLKSKEGA